MTPPSIVAPVRRKYRALAVAFVPSACDLDEASWLRAESIVDGALWDRPPGIRRQILLFVRILNVLAALRYGRGLAALDPVRLRGFLGSLERAPVLLLRRGVWGLRTLVYMGHYGQEGIRRSVGYAAAPGGWGAAGGDGGPWPDRGGGGAPEDDTLTADPAPHELGDARG